jgi:hypothetical protein
MRCESMSLAERITEILRPHMGEHTADSVARHLCAKHGVGDGPISAEIQAQLHETLRRGLVAFVGPQRAEELARQCLPAVESPKS